SSRRRHTRFSRDWSSDVCSSDLRRFVDFGIVKRALPYPHLKEPPVEFLSCAAHGQQENDQRYNPKPSHNILPKKRLKALFIKRNSNSVWSNKLPPMEETDHLDDDLFEHYRITANPGQDLLRIDKFLFARLPNVTRTKVQAGIREGFVKVNDKLTKSNYKIHPGDVITVSFPEPPHSNEVVPEEIPLDIVYEDNYLLVVNKPP